MTIQIAETLFTINAEEMVKNFKLLPKEYDMRIERTDEMVDSKLKALYFPEEDIVRVEQPFLVYEENGNTYIVNGITRFLAIQKILETNKYSDIAPITYMKLEDGWTVDDLKSLQHSANDFTQANDEYKLGLAVVELREKYFDTILSDLTAKNETIKVKKDRLNPKQIKDTAASQANDSVLRSSLMRGKNAMNLKYYRAIAGNDSETLKTFLESKVITVRNAADFITAYNKFDKTCQKIPIDTKDISSQDFVLKSVFALNESLVNSINEKNKDKEDFQPETVKISRPEFEAWFKENTPKKVKDSEDSEGGEEIEDDSEIDINYLEINNLAKNAIAFGLTYKPSDIKSVIKEKVCTAKTKLDFVSALIDSTTDPSKLECLDEIITAFTEFMGDMDVITPETIKVEKLAKALIKHSKAIDNYQAAIVKSEQIKSSNVIETVPEAEESGLTEEIGEYVISA